MRLSRAYIPTQKENPADATIPSHQLMLRAGLIRQLFSGVYSYLPFGWAVLKKAMGIIREEMDRIGAQELYLPVINPIEIWDETGRNSDFGDNMMRLKDRRNHMLCLAPTHEEVICDLARKYIRSYKDMPQMWYQIQTKFRDEPRPRSGVIRARQFFMKDSYSLDSDEEGLEKSYRLHEEAYRKIFTRCGLHFHVVGASSGLMGGSASQEFMLESQFGEDTLILCSHCDYAANLEIARSIPLSGTNRSDSLEKVHTPEKRTIEEVSQYLGLKPEQLMKSLIYMLQNEPVMILIRGDHEVNESKLQYHFRVPLQPATPEEIIRFCGVEPGFLGPVYLKKPIRVVADLALQGPFTFTSGANEKNYHIKGIKLDRDVKVEAFDDFRNVLPGEKCTACGKPIRFVQAIELGHIFKLGTKYSESMKALFLDKNGKERPIVMGSYGIGVERIIAASIEQNHDKKGIVWDRNLTPFNVTIILINADNKEVLETSETLYNSLIENGISTLIDDRKVTPGFKFKDADLLGVPVQIIVGEKWIKEKKFEVRQRKDGTIMYTSNNDILKTIKQLVF